MKIAGSGNWNLSWLVNVWEAVRKLQMPSSLGGSNCESMMDWVIESKQVLTCQSVIQEWCWLHLVFRKIDFFVIVPLSEESQLMKIHQLQSKINLRVSDLKIVHSKFQCCTWLPPPSLFLLLTPWCHQKLLCSEIPIKRSQEQTHLDNCCDFSEKGYEAEHQCVRLNKMQ